MPGKTKVKSRPILFSAPMVRAILQGRKTQTRRIVKQKGDSERHLKLHRNRVWASLRSDEVEFGATTTTIYGSDEVLFDKDHAYTPVVIGGGKGRPLQCPYGAPGDRLWVREKFTYWERPGDGHDFIKYLADDALVSLGKWKHPHPIYEHCVGRFGKTVPSIHMPRWASRIDLEVINVRVERLHEISDSDAIAEGCQCAGVPTSISNIGAFAKLWEQINGKGSWCSNPWVWVVVFKRV